VKFTERVPFRRRSPFANACVEPGRLSVVPVGDASKVLPQLKAIGVDNVEVLPLADLDLTSPSLRRKGPVPSLVPGPLTAASAAGSPPRCSVRAMA